MKKVKITKKGNLKGNLKRKEHLIGLSKCLVV